MLEEKIEICRIEESVVPLKPFKELPWLVAWARPWLDTLAKWYEDYNGGFFTRDQVVRKDIIHNQDLATLVAEQVKRIYKSTRKWPTRMIIGSDAYQELTSQVLRDEEYTIFPFQLRRYFNSSEGPPEHNANVEIVPWMKGVLVLP